jgi:hypothetical protein
MRGEGTKAAELLQILEARPPKGADFSLYIRAYWPKTAIIDGS